MKRVVFALALASGCAHPTAFQRQYWGEKAAACVPVCDRAMGVLSAVVYVPSEDVCRCWLPLARHERLAFTRAAEQNIQAPTLDPRY